MFLSYCQRPSFTPVQNHRQNCRLLYSDSRREDRRFWTEW
jgi:hypothetical protein